MTLTKIHSTLAKIVLLSCGFILLVLLMSAPSVLAAPTLPTNASAPGGGTPGIGASAASPNDQGHNSLSDMATEYVAQHPEVNWLTQDQRDKNNNAIPGFVNPALVPGAGPFGTMYPPTPAAAMGWKTESKLYEAMYNAGLQQLGGFNGQVNSDLKSYSQELQAGDFLARTLQYPPNVANQARAQATGQAQTMGNAMGDIAKSQSESAITYCAGFLKNFTVDEGNKWNQIRNGLFIPIAILLLLPGAILTQVKAMASSGNPVISDGQTNPLEGILRSVVAIFLIPATYLVVNYGIDFSNSIIDSVAGTYTNVVGGNMYQDAFSAEVRAFPVRTPKENQGGSIPQDWPQKAIKTVSDFESDYIANKTQDPSTNTYTVPANMTDEAMPGGAVAARQLSFGANAALTAGWNILCAFQMAYLSYLFFVGPVVAALWVWPMKHFRDALPNWVEGVITLCFWSLFWNTAILLMACFKGVDESGTIIMSALNFLATASVKFAFDFAGLVRAAGQEAGNQATQKAGAQGSSGSQGSAGQTAQSKPATANNTAPANNTAKTAGGANGGTQQTDPTGSTKERQNTLANSLANTKAAAPQRADFYLAGTVPPPPISLTPTHGQNGIQSQSMQLGNYTLSRGFNSDGKPVDLLKSNNGHVIAELPKNMANGQSYTANGIEITHNKNGQGSSYTLTDATGQSHTASVPSLAGTTAGSSVAGALSPTGDANKNSIALQSAAGTMLLENNGNTLLMPRADGKGFDSFSLEQGAKAGSFPLADGRTLSLAHNPDGSEQVSLTNPKNGQNETFAVSPNANGFEIAHAVNGTANGSTTVNPEGNSTVYSNYDANGRLTDIDKVTGNSTASTLYDPQKGQVSGYMVSNYRDDGSSQTNYYGPDKSLTATAEHSRKSDGGFLDRVLDNAGQNLNAPPLLSSSGSAFDAHDKLIATSPPPVQSMLRAVTPTADALTDTKQMAQDIVQGNQSGNADYLQRMANATGMSGPDLVNTAQQAVNGDPYAQTQLMAAYASNSGDQQFLQAVASGTNMSVTDVQALAPQAASGNAFAQTQLMAASATQSGDVSFFNQIAEVTQMPLSNVQAMTREAANGDVFAQTKLASAHATQSGDSGFFNKMAEATQMPVADVQTLAREATGGNVFAQTKLAAAQAVQSGDSGFFNQMAEATKMPVADVQTLSREASSGNVYAQTQLTAAHAVQSGDFNEIANATQMSAPDAKIVSQLAAQGNVYAQTQMMAASAAQSPESSLVSQLAAASNMSVPQVQSLTREAASGNVLAETQLRSACAAQSQDADHINTIAEATQLSAPQVQALTREAASGNVYAGARVMSAYATESPELVNRIAEATSMPVPAIQNLTRQAVEGNVYAETRLAAAFTQQPREAIGPQTEQPTIAYEQSFITGQANNLSVQPVFASTSVQALNLSDNTLMQQMQQVANANQNSGKQAIEERYVGTPLSAPPTVYAYQSGDNSPLSQTTQQSGAQNLNEVSRVIPQPVNEVSRTASSFPQAVNEVSRTASYDSHQAVNEVSRPSTSGAHQAVNEVSRPSTSGAPQAVNEVSRPSTSGAPQAVNEVSRPASYASSQAVNEVSRPASYASSQAVNEVSRPASYASSQAVNEVSRPASYASSQAVNEVSRPASHASSQAVNEVSRPATSGSEGPRRVTEFQQSFVASATSGVSKNVDASVARSVAAEVQKTCADPMVISRQPNAALPAHFEARHDSQTFIAGSTSTASALAKNTTNETAYSQFVGSLPLCAQPQPEVAEPQIVEVSMSSPEDWSKNALSGDEQGIVYCGVTSEAEVNEQSLQQQLIDAGNHNLYRQRTIGQVLKSASPSQTESEALANAHVNYTVLCSLLNKGLTYQAQQLLSIVDRDIQILGASTEARALVEAYIDLLTRHQLTEQAQAFQNHLHPDLQGYSLSSTW